MNNSYMDDSIYHLTPMNPTIEDTSRVDVFDEEYIGKLPEFVKISQIFDAMIEKAKKDPLKMNPNEWKENQQICDIFAKVFGLKRVWFYWIPSDTRNAFTVTLQSFLILGDSKELIEYRAGKGFYDTSHKSIFTVYGYCGLLLPETNMTGKELTAIFLHEFGHNFDYSPYHHVSFMMQSAIEAGGSTIEQNNQVKMDYYNHLTDQWDGFYRKTDKRREKQREKYKKALDRYFNSGLIPNLFSTLKNMVYLPIALAMTPFTLTELDAKKGEQWADSFATAYGYGPELITGLDKLGRYDNIERRKVTKATIFFRDLSACMGEIINGLLECHGTHQERCKDCIAKLKRDLAEADYPPAMKKDLETEIQRLEEIYAGIITASPDEQEKITKAWRRICDRVFGGRFNLAKFFKPNQM